MADMTDLITRLEEATEGSRELDGAIDKAIDNWRDPPPTVHDPYWCSSHYTTSLDVALTLTPPHMHWKEVLTKALDLLTELVPKGPLTMGRFILCVCVAALRARENG